MGSCQGLQHVSRMHLVRAHVCGGAMQAGCALNAVMGLKVCAARVEVGAWEIGSCKRE